MSKRGFWPRVVAAFVLIILFWFLARKLWGLGFWPTTALAYIGYVAGLVGREAGYLWAKGEK